MVTVLCPPWRRRRSARRVSPPMLLLLLSLAGAGELPAQEAKLSASADSAVRRVGEQARITVVWEGPGDATLRAVGPSDSLGALEIVAADTGATMASRLFVVTSFDTGLHVMPPFTAWYAAAGDTAIRSVSSGPLVFSFRGVEVDTAGEIREIKPPLGVPLSFAEALPWILAAAGAAALFWAVRHLLRKRRRGEAILPEAPRRPEDEEALEALRSIESERLWQRGMVKEYHTAVSDVLRNYLERRYAIPAMESTTDEILDSPAVASLAGEAAGRLRGVLSTSDLVKFAKHIPTPERNERSLADASEFVRETRRRRDPAEGKVGTTAPEGIGEAGR